jgi:hypothetical protein
MGAYDMVVENDVVNAPLATTRFLGEGRRLPRVDIRIPGSRAKARASE